MAPCSPSLPLRRRPGQGTASVVGNQVQFDPGTRFRRSRRRRDRHRGGQLFDQDQFGAPPPSSTVTITVNRHQRRPGRQSRHRLRRRDTRRILGRRARQRHRRRRRRRPDRHRRLGACAGTYGHAASVVGNQVTVRSGAPDFDDLAVGETAAMVVSYTDRRTSTAPPPLDDHHHRHRHQRRPGRQPRHRLGRREPDHLWSTCSPTTPTSTTAPSSP